MRTILRSKSWRCVVTRWMVGVETERGAEWWFGASRSMHFGYFEDGAGNFAFWFGPFFVNWC